MCSNFTLVRRDSYLEYLHAGVKQDTLTALCTAPVLIKTEEEVARSEESRSSSQSQRKLVVSIHMLPMTNLLIYGPEVVYPSLEANILTPAGKERSWQAYNFLTETVQGFKTS